MSSHDATIALYLTLLLTMIGVDLVATRSTSKIPTLGTVNRRVGTTRSGRVALPAGWAWLGLHFFAR